MLEADVAREEAVVLVRPQRPHPEHVHVAVGVHEEQCLLHRRVRQRLAVQPQLGEADQQTARVVRRMDSRPSPATFCPRLRVKKVKDTREVDPLAGEPEPLGPPRESTGKPDHRSAPIQSRYERSTTPSFGTSTNRSRSAASRD